jgi:hypothetical protein
VADFYRKFTWRETGGVNMNFFSEKIVAENFSEAISEAWIRSVDKSRASSDKEFIKPCSIFMWKCKGESQKQALLNCSRL